MANIIETIKYKINSHLRRNLVTISFPEGTTIITTTGEIRTKRQTQAGEVFSVRHAKWSEEMTTGRTTDGSYLKALIEPISIQISKK